MRFTMPFPYTVIHRKSEDAPQTVSIGVAHAITEVREASEHEVTPIVSWSSVTGNRQTCIRFEGSLYVHVPTQTSKPFIADEVEIAAALNSGQLGSFTTVLGSRELGEREHRVLLKAMAEGKVPNISRPDLIVGSNGESREAVATERANAVISYGGHLYMQVPWIAMRVSPYVGGRSRAYVESGPVGFDRITRIDMKPRKPPADIQFVSFADFDHYSNQPEWNRLLHHYSDLEIFDGASDFDPAREFLDRSVHYVLGWSQSEIGRMSAVTAANWTELAEYLRSTDAEKADRTFEEVHCLLAELVPFLSPDVKAEDVERMTQVLGNYAASRASDATPSAACFLR